MNFIAASAQNVREFFLDFWGLLAGLLMSILGYFLPIRDLVHLVTLFFIVEMFSGYFAAKIKNHYVKFSLTIVYTKTIPRLFISIVILILSFLWDTVTEQKWLPTYNILGWFFCGVLLLKITRHGYIITKWAGFLYASKIIDHKINDKSNELDI